MSQSVFSWPNLKEDIYLPNFDEKNANIAYLPNIFNIKRVPEHMSGHGLCCKIVQLKHLFISQWEGKKR